MINDMPTIRLTSEQLAAIKDWQVGGKYKLCVEVEETAMRQGNEYDFDESSGANKDLITATFKVTGVKVMDEKEEEAESDDTAGMDYETEYASRMNKK